MLPTKLPIAAFYRELLHTIDSGRGGPKLRAGPGIAKSKGLPLAEMAFAVKDDLWCSPCDRDDLFVMGEPDEQRICHFIRFSGARER